MSILRRAQPSQTDNGATPESTHDSNDTKGNVIYISERGIVCNGTLRVDLLLSELCWLNALIAFELLSQAPPENAGTSGSMNDANGDERREALKVGDSSRRQNVTEEQPHSSKATPDCANS